MIRNTTIFLMLIANLAFAEYVDFRGGAIQTLGLLARQRLSINAQLNKLQQAYIKETDPQKKAQIGQQIRQLQAQRDAGGGVAEANANAASKSGDGFDRFFKMLGTSMLIKSIGEAGQNIASAVTSPNSGASSTAAIGSAVQSAATSLSTQMNTQLNQAVSAVSADFNNKLNDLSKTLKNSVNDLAARTTPVIPSVNPALNAQLANLLDGKM